MLRLKRVVIAALGVCLIGSLTWTGGTVAQADELNDAKEELTRLQGEASTAADEYNDVKADMKAAKTKLKQIKDDINVQQEKVDALRDQVTVVTLQQFQDRGASATAVLFSSDNQEEALNRIALTSMVTDATTAILQNYQLSTAHLEDLQRSQVSTIASIKKDQSRLEELKNTAAEKVKEAEDLVDRLTAEERARLAAIANIANQNNKNKPTTYNPPPPVTNGPAAEAVVAYVMARVGQPYVYGGEGPWGYDCSGLTMMAYRSVGISLPHGSRSQFNYGQPVSMSDLQAGDLVFFYAGPGHVGIYVGGGMIVDARNENTGIVYTSINTGMPFVGARRLL